MRVRKWDKRRADTRGEEVEGGVVKEEGGREGEEATHGE